MIGTNYPSWRAQFTSLLIGYGLLDSSTCPPRTTSNSTTAAPSISPAYQHWYCQDKLLLNATFSSVSENVMPLVATADTSREARCTLEKLLHLPPNYLKLRTFGCLRFPWTKPYNSHKLQSKSVPCIFISYSYSQSAYLCLHLETNRTITSRHVTLLKKSFPSAHQPLLQITQLCRCHVTTLKYLLFLQFFQCKVQI